MLRNVLSIAVLTLSLVSHAAENAKTTSVICSTTGPRIEGFELVRVSPRKRSASGSHDVRSHNWRDGGMRFQGTYDVESGRLKADLNSVDEDGEVVQFLGSVDAFAGAGNHLRTVFVTPAAEKIELVCNVVAH